jgi:predicted LPLAT superfamily acyltransferase
MDSWQTIEKEVLFMSRDSKWDGKGKGSRLGNLIAMKIILFFGPLPAYGVVVMAALRYTLFDRVGIKALRKFRKAIGLKSTNIFHLHRHFCSFGFSLVDKFAFLTSRKPRFRYTCINEDAIAKILDEKGKGAILVSAHIGSWEIAGKLFTNRNKTRIHAIILDNEHEKLKEVYRKALDNREFSLIRVSPDSLDLMLPVKDALQKNEIICMSGDRVIGQTGVEIPFFGNRALFPAGPFQIAAITGAPVIPVFVVKDRMNHYTLKAFDPICFDNVTRENRADLVQQGMETFVGNLEEISRKYPYQWFNFYDIWTE